MKNKKIFLTGGTGFFGKSILSMLKRGFLPDTEFVLLSRTPQAFLTANPEFTGMNNIRFVSGDIRNFEFPREDFDYIIHAAAPSVFVPPPGEERSIIIEGTARVIEFAKFCGAEKLLFTSSGAVYGVQPPELKLIPEDFPCRPVNEYGMAKLDAEKMCVDSGVYTLLPRCFAFVGPYLNLNAHFAVGNFIQDCIDGRPIIIKGDGRPFRSYMYADDLVQWLFAILLHGENGRPYNVGSDQAVSIADLAAEVAAHFTPAPEIRIMGTAEPDSPTPRYVPDISRVKNELGVCLNFNLKQAVKNTLELL